MFKPIIHNLTPNCTGYKETQLYNSLIANKPKGDGTLTTKLAKIKAWRNLCNQALESARQAITN
jgi:hypothetical protein